MRSIDSAWRRPETVRGFAQSPPNATLLAFAAAEQSRHGGTPLALDIGCGAARNAAPLAAAGWKVIAADLSRPMLDAAAERARADGVASRLRVLTATMTELPLGDATVDLVIAHGIWNLARSVHELRTSVREAARVSTPGAGLFVFTFSRHTLPPEAQPIAGEAFVFTQFSGQPQCFLTAEQLIGELGEAGFTLDPFVPLTEHNRPQRGVLVQPRVPVIYEGAFRRRS